MTKATPRSSDTAFADRSWQALRILTFYRLVLAGLLTVLYFTLQVSNPFSTQNHQLFRATLLAY